MNNRSIIFFSAIAFGVAFSWFFIWPKLGSIETIKKDLDAASQERVVLQETIDNISSQANFYRSLTEEQIELLNLAAPSYPDEINLVDLLYKKIADKGMIANEVTAEPQRAAPSSVQSPASERPLEVTVSISATGSYGSFKELLAELENNLRIMDIESIVIDNNLEEDGGSSPTFSITGNAYYITESMTSGN